MKFVCERCHTKYSIADDKVRQKILKIRCKTCENVITIRDAVVVHEPRVASEPRGVRAVPPAPPPRAPRAIEWHVAIDGKQEGPMGLAALVSRIQANSRNSETYVWNEHLDGWKEPRQVPEVAAELRGKVTLPPPPPLPIAGGKRLPSAARSAVSSPLPAQSASPIASISGGRRSGNHGAVDIAAKSTGMSSSPSPSASSGGLAAVAAGFGGVEQEAERTQVDAGLLMGDLASQAAVAKHAATAYAPLQSPEVSPSISPARATSGAMGAMLKANGAPAPGGASVSGLEALDFVPGPGGPSGSHPILGVSSGGHPILGMAPPGAVTAPLAGGSTAMLLVQAGVRASRPRHPAFKFVVTGGLLVGLTVVVAVLAMSDRDRGGGMGKPALAGATPAAAPEAEARARAEAEKVFKSMVGEKTPPPAPTTPSTKTIAAPPTRRGAARSKGASAEPVAPPPVAPPPLSAGGTPAPDGVGVARRFAQDERKVAAPGKDHGGSKGGGGEFDHQKFMGVFKQQDHHTAIKSCYERALKRDERLKAARLDISVNVGETGSVKKVRVDAPPEFNSVSGCIREAVRRWRFPSTNSEYEATFPLILHGSAE